MIRRGRGPTARVRAPLETIYSRNAPLGDAAEIVATHESTSPSMAVQVCVCAVQSAAFFALLHALVNLSSHFMSLAGSALVPFFCAFEMTLALHATFLPAALVTPESHLDCASAFPPTISDNTAAITAARIFISFRTK